MKSVNEVLQQKETDLARVRQEIESLRIVASLLSDEPTEELTRKHARSEEEILDPGAEKATGTDGMFSSIDSVARPGFWNTLKRQK
jgi:hypothetical protein